MIELLRRIALLAGVGVFLWLWLESIPAVLEVTRADFAGQYQKRYGQRQQPANANKDSKGLDRPLVVEDSPVKSVAAFAERQTKNRLLQPGDFNWAEFYRSLPANAAYYSIDQPPFAALRPQIETNMRRTGFATSYLPVRDADRIAYLEVDYRDRPKESKAPSALLYPKRGRAWPWLLAGLLIYFVLPWRRAAGAVVYSRTVVWVIDSLGLAFAAFFFALPLYVGKSTATALGADFGLTVFLWVLASAGFVMVFWAARLAGFRVTPSPSGLSVRTIWGEREIPFADLASTGYMVRQEIRTGIFLNRRDGTVVKLNWAGLLGFESILEAISRAGVPQALDLAH